MSTIPEKNMNIVNNISKSVVISLKNVSMFFNVANQNVSSLKEMVISTVKNELKYREFHALEDISFDIFKGEVVGIIGTNGSGKSTLMKIISGALKPTSGEVEVDPLKVQILSLGTGFDYELTAKENVYLNGSIIGYSKEFIDSVYDDIVEFAELKDFMNEKVKNFSSGMVSRLGFAIATIGNVPEILILDEVLSVGDEFFRRKSLKKIKEIIHSGSTVIMVSHNMGTIRDNCDKVIWIEKGKLKMIGSPEEVCSNYKYSGSKTPSQIKLIDAVSVDDFLEVRWEAEETADSYVVFRKTDNTKWKKIGVSEDISFADKRVLSGIKYTYTVRGVNSNGMSPTYSKTGVNALCTAPPANVRLKDAVGFEKQIIVRWKSVESDVTYNVYRKSDDDTNWKLISQTRLCRYTDYNVEPNKVYCYTIRAVNKYGISKRYDRAGVSASLHDFETGKLKVSIVGSCQSRDIFNSKFISDYKSRFEVISYFTMASMLSVMSKSVKYNYDNLEHAKTNNYQKERFYCELEKNILMTLASKVPDILILDFYADARYGVISYDEGFVLNRYSRLDNENVFDYSLFGDVYNYRINKNEFLENWKLAVDKFMRFMKEFLPDTRIILNTVKGSNMILEENGKRYISPKLVDLNIKSINSTWREMDDYLISSYADVVTPIYYEKKYDLNPDYLFGLGVALVHFHQEYYDYYYESLLLSTSDMHTHSHKNSNINLIKHQDFLECTDYWSRAVEISESPEAVYTISFDILISDTEVDYSDIDIFKIRSFKYFNNSDSKDAIEEIILKLSNCDIRNNEVYRYTYSFSINGKYIRMLPVYNPAISGLKIVNVQLERNDVGSDYRPYYDFDEYTVP